MATPPVEHVVILTAAAVVGGRRRSYASDPQVARAVEQFGHAVSVERVEDAAGTVQYRVTCAQQRGDAGAYRMHTIACNHSIPVHIE